MNKRKKSAILFLIILAAISIIAFTVNFIADKLFTDRSSGVNSEIFLYTPNFNSDIMSEEEYLSKDRIIKYSDGALTHEIASDTWENPDNTAQAFMIDYIKTLVSGDGKKLRSLYTDDVIRELKIPDTITEQRIYECVFTHVSRKEVKDDGEVFLRYEVKVEYKIMRNDGTFRADIASDSIKPQILTIDDRQAGCIISKVVEYVPR